VVAAGASFASYWVVRYLDGVALAEERTASTLVLAVVGLWILSVLARPITPFRAMLIAAMAGAFGAVLAVPGLRDWFALDLPKPAALTLSAIIAGTAGVIETDYHNHTNRAAAPSYRIKRGTDWQAEFETVAVPSEDGFRVEIDAFADLVEQGDRAAVRARRVASLDNAWTLAAILEAARR
jgi:tellurite resistance protein TehA-like permease